MKRSWLVAALVALPYRAWAAEPGTPPVPAPVRALAGCWEGEGQVMDKPVTITVAAKPIAEGALLALDAQSRTVADAADRYAAHLIFGGTGKKAESDDGAISGFWSDSFGGAYTAMGHGQGTADGFVISYAYPDNAFVNRWRLAGDRVAWQIVAVDAKGAEQPFASYALRKAPCHSAP